MTSDNDIRRFEVVCDKTNNTEESMDKGELHVDFKSVYQMEIGEKRLVIPPDWQDHRDRVVTSERLTAYIEKAIADAFNLPLFTHLEQKQVDSTTKELVDEIASLKAEVAVLNARDMENKRVIEEAMKLNNELEKALVAAEKKLAIFEKWEPVLASALQKKPSAASAINKIGKTPHAAWHSIVDNENEGQF